MDNQPTEICSEDIDHIVKIIESSEIKFIPCNYCGIGNGLPTRAVGMAINGIGLNNICQECDKKEGYPNKTPTASVNDSFWRTAIDDLDLL